MPLDTEILERLYERFNARDIDAALATMHPDVMWANGLEGGHIHGQAGIRVQIEDGLIKRFDIRKWPAALYNLSSRGASRASGAANLSSMGPGVVAQPTHAAVRVGWALNSARAAPTGDAAPT